MADRVILLELNELSGTVVDALIARGELPAFERLRRESATFTTDAGEQGERLNPWVQWVTVHTGVDLDVHRVAKLGAARHNAVDTVADLVARDGGATWLCGSMNIEPSSGAPGGWIPDPWTPGGRAEPPELAPYYEFVAAQVQEHTSGRRVGGGEAIRFARFMAGHGLRPATAAAAVGQLAGERLARAPRWRRPIVLDRFQWDLFEWGWQRFAPRFATFFSNSTAHLQHLHWGDEVPATPPVVAGYRAMDRLIARCLRRFGDEATIVLCTALGQRANEPDARLGYEGFHRIISEPVLVSTFGLDGLVGYAPVMAEQVRLTFRSDELATAAAATLTEARLGDRPAFEARRDGRELFVGCRAFRPLDSAAPLVKADGSTIPWDELLYWSPSPRAGTHDPHGFFWVRGAATGSASPVPLTAVAPTLCELLGIEPGVAMGDSLLGTTARRHR